jgi:hypothetical protein
MRHRKVRFNERGASRACFCTLDGSKRMANPSRHRNVEQDTEADQDRGDDGDEELAAPADTLSAEVRRILAEPHHDEAREVLCEGASPASVADRKGVHRATIGRRVRRLKAALKLELLASIAHKTLNTGTDGFTVFPHTAEFLHGADGWCVGILRTESRYNHDPTLNDFRHYITTHAQSLFGAHDLYLSCNRAPVAFGWTLVVTRLFPSFASALFAAGPDAQHLIFSIDRRRDLLRVARRAA